MFNLSPFNTALFNAANAEPPSNDMVISELITVNAAFPNLAEVVSDGLGLGETLSAIQSSILYSGISISTTAQDILISQIFETISQTSTVVTTGVLHSFLSEVMEISDVLRIAFPVVINSGITTSSSFAELLQKYNHIFDELRALSSHSTSVELSNSIAASIAILSVLSLNSYLDTLEEDLTIAQTLVDVYVAVNTLLEAIVIEDLPEESVSIFMVTSEDLNIADELAFRGDYSSTLDEDVVFVITYKSGDTVFQGYSYAPETFSVTEYDNFPFTSSAYFNGNYLLANEEGIYLLGGKLDDGEFIRARIKTAAMDFETSNLKQVPKVYLGISNDASLVLSVAVDGKYKAQYQLDINSEDLSTQMFNIGKGLVGRYWQFTLDTKGNTNFDLDEIEIFPLVFGRKR